MSLAKSSSIVGLVLALGALAQRPADGLPQEFSAVAIGTGGALTRPVATQVDVRITRWSTAGETERLLTTLKEKGPDALLEAVRDAKSVGTIRTPGSLAYDLRYAQQELQGDGLRRIVLITDRPMSIWETVNRPRSFDYPFTFLELRLNARGEGEGKLNLATRIEISRNGRMLELENYDNQPIALNEVRQSH
jgi:hypothetical protein